MALGSGDGAGEQCRQTPGLPPVQPPAAPRVTSSDCLTLLGPHVPVHQTRACCGSRGLSLCLPGRRGNQSGGSAPLRSLPFPSPFLGPRAASCWSGSQSTCIYVLIFIQLNSFSSFTAVKYTCPRFTDLSKSQPTAQGHEVHSRCCAAFPIRNQNVSSSQMKLRPLRH